jgi:hypothetical protein
MERTKDDEMQEPERFVENGYILYDSLVNPLTY